MAEPNTSDPQPEPQPESRLEPQSQAQPDGEDRFLVEDDACPVEIESGVDAATPEDWDWRLIGTSQPNRATFHLSHSDVTQVKVDVLRPADSPPDAPFRVTRDIPIVIIDSLDQYWAGESRTRLPLQGLRVPVSADTEEMSRTADEAEVGGGFGGSAKTVAGDTCPGAEGQPAIPDFGPVRRPVRGKPEPGNSAGASLAIHRKEVAEPTGQGMKGRASGGEGLNRMDLAGRTVGQPPQGDY